MARRRRRRRPGRRRLDPCQWNQAEAHPLGVEGPPCARLPILWSGESSLGKSTFFCWIASELTHGRLEGHLHGEPAKVLIVASEDAREDMWGPRLTVAGADLDLVEFQDQSAEWNLRDGMRLTERVVDQIKPKLVFIDSVFEHMPPTRGSESIYSTDFIRRSLGPFRNLCRTCNVAGLISTHPPKGKGSTFADMVIASAAFVHVTRVGLLFAWHPDDVELPEGDRRRVLMRPPGGSNIGRNPGSFEFSVRTRDLLIETSSRRFPTRLSRWRAMPPSATWHSAKERAAEPNPDRRGESAHRRAAGGRQVASVDAGRTHRGEFGRTTVYRAAEPCVKKESSKKEW